MGREHRRHFKGAVFRIRAGCCREEGMFRDDIDRVVLLNQLDEIQMRSGIQIYGYCLLPHELDLVFQVGKATAGEVMHDLLLAYAKYYNKRYHLSGHLLDRTHREELLAPDQSLLRVILEIHMRPVTEGLVRRPQEWFWSGYGELRGLRRRWLISTSLPETTLAAPAALGAAVQAVVDLNDQVLFRNRIRHRIRIPH